MTETTQIETPNPESFAALFEASATRTDQLREGDIVAGTILTSSSTPKATSRRLPAMPSTS
jgi:hypothetical protein